jgi:hypothetical protein
MRLPILVALIIGASSLINSAMAGNNVGNMHAAVRAKCHEALDGKHLSKAAYASEWAKCKEDPDNYQYK